MCECVVCVCTHVNFIAFLPRYLPLVAESERCQRNAQVCCLSLLCLPAKNKGKVGLSKQQAHFIGSQLSEFGNVKVKIAASKLVTVIKEISAS